MKSKKAILYLCILLTTFCSIRFVSGEETISEEELSNVSKAGTYDVQIDAYDDNGKKYSKVVKVIVTFPNSVINYDNQEGIDATDIKIDKTEDIMSFSNQDLVDKANAHAWDLQTGEKVEIDSVKIDTQNKTHVTFATKKGTEITVNCISGVEVLTTQNSLYNYVLVDESRQEIWVDFGIFILLLMFLPILLFTIIYLLLQRKIKQIKQVLYTK
ncbi:MAG: hypothetical protein ACK5LC_00440 [Coprobacillaceae bacterium]